MTIQTITQDHFEFLEKKPIAGTYCNLEMATQFLTFLAEGENVTFQTFDDDSKRKNRSLARILHGKLEAHAEALISLNQQGAGIFVTINQTDGKGRETSNIIKIRSVFIDLDGSSLEPVMNAPISPHFIIESSPKRYHAYWQVEDLPLADFSIVQDALAKKFNGDPVVKDLPRVMRLPGFIHQKGTSFQTRILECSGGLPIKASEFIAKFGVFLDKSTSKSSPGTDGANPNPIFNAIKSAGILIGKDGISPGRWHIRCPWKHLHSNQDVEAHYLEPNTNGYSGHGFKCFHSHCSERKGEDLLNWLGEGLKRSEDSSNSWENPIPLQEGLPIVAKLEPDMLPESIRGWVMDIAERMQIPPDFSAASVIVVLSSLIGRKIGVMPKQKDDWLVTPNLWGAIVGRPSLLKSPAIAQIMKPLDKLVLESSKKYEDDTAKFKLNEMTSKAKKEALQTKLNQEAKKTNSNFEKILEDNVLADLEEPILKRYKTEDGTTEKIGEILLQNPNGILIHRDELTGWLKSLDKDGREGDRAFYLEAWNGSGSFTVDRIKRGTLHIPSLCLSILGGIQPGPLSSYIYQALKGFDGDDGLIQRFQLLVWPDAPKEWKNVDRWPDNEAKNRAYEVFKKLDQYVHPLGPEDLDTEISAVRFSIAAQEVFNTWRDNLEKRLRSGGLSAAMESHLAKYRSLLPSLSLIFQLCNDLDRNLATHCIENEAIELAAKWCSYLETHAQRLYSSIENANIDSAGELLQRIRKGDVRDGFSMRDVYLKHWSKLASPDEMQRAVDILILHGWLRMEEVKTQGRTKQIIRIHPQLILIERNLNT